MRKRALLTIRWRLSLALFMRPADVTIPRCALPSGGAKAEQGDGLLGGVDEVAQLRAGKRFVSEVMVALDIFVPEARFDLFCTRDASQRRECTGRWVERFSRIVVRADANTRIGPLAARRGQLDEAVVVHPQHGDPCGHVFQSAIGLEPVQRPAGQP